MTDFSGRLSRAPVVYVLCQIRFSAVLKMADYLPQIQEALRDRYPRFRHEVINTLAISAKGGAINQVAEDRWVMNDVAETSGYLVQKAAMVFHTTAYLDFEDFLRKTIDGMREVTGAAKISLFERVGLRYIDLIVPDRDEGADAYLHSGLNGLSFQPLGFQRETMQQFASARTDIGRLVLKVSSGSHQQVVPGDLQPLSLKSKDIPVDRSTTMLDSDHFVEDGLEPDLKRLESVIRQLHGPISQVFRAAITKHAVEKWK
jgi:uncharacterized protein (TIGR04255 family)